MHVYITRVVPALAAQLAEELLERERAVGGVSHTCAHLNK